MTQSSKVSEYMKTGIYVAFLSLFLGIFWFQIYFFLVFDIQNVLFHISGSQTSVHIRIIRGYLIKMKTNMPFAQRYWFRRSEVRPDIFIWCLHLFIELSHTCIKCAHLKFTDQWICKRLNYFRVVLGLQQHREGGIEVSLTAPASTHASSPINIIPQNGTHFPKSEITLTHCNHPKVIVHLRVSPWCCILCRFEQMYSNICPPF